MQRETLEVIVIMATKSGTWPVIIPPYDIVLLEDTTVMSRIVS
jgi:hypothetical protein